MKKLIVKMSDLTDRTDEELEELAKELGILKEKVIGLKYWRSVVNGRTGITQLLKEGNGVVQDLTRRDLVASILADLVDDEDQVEFHLPKAVDVKINKYQIGKLETVIYMLGRHFTRNFTLHPSESKAFKFACTIKSNGLAEVKEVVEVPEITEEMPSIKVDRRVSKETKALALKSAKALADIATNLNHSYMIGRLGRSGIAVNLILCKSAVRLLMTDKQWMAFNPEKFTKLSILTQNLRNHLRTESNAHKLYTKTYSRLDVHGGYRAPAALIEKLCADYYAQEITFLFLFDEHA